MDTPMVKTLGFETEKCDCHNISVAIRRCRQNPEGLEDHREKNIIWRTVTGINLEFAAS